MEISNRIERMNLDHKREPYASHLQDSCRMKMNRRVARDGALHATYDLFAIRGRHHGLQIVRHGDDGQQHRNQNQIGNPRCRMGVNIVLRRNPAPASCVEQQNAQAHRRRQPQKIE